METKENKIRLLVLIILIIITVFIVVVNIFISRKHGNELENSIEKIGAKFYQEYLYKNKYDIITKCVDDGRSINISIIDIIKAADNLDKKNIENMTFFKKCNISNSNIIYTPHSPISEKNYDMEVNLDCDE